MGLKSEMQEMTYQIDRSYPYLGTVNGFTVLFSGPKTGMLVHIKKGFGGHPLGHYMTDWGEHNFTPILGSITLSNE